VGKVLALADEVTAPSSAYPFEVLYGAAGYLSALAFLRSNGFSAAEVPDAAVAAVARHIVERGEDGPGCVGVWMKTRIDVDYPTL
jgi:hypothetical protein